MDNFFSQHPLSTEYDCKKPVPQWREGDQDTDAEQDDDQIKTDDKKRIERPAIPNEGGTGLPEQGERMFKQSEYAHGDGISGNDQFLLNGGACQRTIDDDM